MAKLRGGLFVDLDASTGTLKRALFVQDNFQEASIHTIFDEYFVGNRLTYV